MDVKIRESRSSSRSSSRSLSPKGVSGKSKQPVVKSYRSRNHSSSPEHKGSKHHRQSRSRSRDRKPSSRRLSLSQERSHKRSSGSPGRESRHGRDKNSHSSREKKTSSREKRRSRSRDRKRHSPGRDKRRSISRDGRHSPRRLSPKRGSPGHERRRSSSHDRKRSPPTKDRSKKARSRSKDRRQKEKARGSPPSSRHYRKRSRSGSPDKKTEAKKTKDGTASTKLTDGSRDGFNTEKPVSALPLNLTMGLLPQSQVTPQLVLQQTMAAVSAQAAGITGVALPKYYNPTAVNPLKYAEQMQKRKLLWQGTKEKVEQQQQQPTSSNIWEKTKFMEDQDGKMTAKFRKLMGIKEDSGEEPVDVSAKSDEPNQVQLKQEALFRDLDQQYEVARISTHTQRGVGLGYSAHPTLVFPK